MGNKVAEILSRVFRGDLGEGKTGLKVFLYGLDGTTPRVAKVDVDGELIAADLGHYRAAHLDSSSPAYYGFLDKAGNWYIMKATTSGNVITYTYCKGSSGYAAAWSDRANQTYGNYDTIF